VGFEESLGDPRDRDTPEADLRALATSQDPIVRLHIAHNPSTPGDVLAMLAMQDGFEIDEFEEDWEPFDYEEDPYFGIDLGDRIFSLHDVIARNPHTPADVLENLYSIGRARAAISSNPRLPDSIVRKIWASGDTDDVHNIIDLNDSLSDAFMIEVASTPDFWIGMEDSIKSALATRADCPAFVLEMLIRQDPEEFYGRVRGAVLGNKNCPEKFLREYSTGAHDYNREIVGGNPSTPPEVLTQLAGDVDKDVREAVAKNHSAPTDILNQLAHDPEWVVRGAVAENPSTPPTALNQLGADPNESILFSVAANPSTLPELLTRLVGHAAEDIRFWVATNPSTLPEVLTQLAEDADEAVRESVAANPSTPSEVRAKLEGEDP